MRTLAAALAVLSMAACSLPDVHTAAKVKTSNLVTQGGSGAGGKR